MDVASHDARKDEILGALNFSEHLSAVRELAVSDFNNGGVGHCKRFFKIPKSTKDVLQGLSSDQLQRVLSDAAGINATTWVVSMPGRVFPGEYSVTIFRI